jgi:hypothetical protein
LARICLALIPRTFYVAPFFRIKTHDDWWDYNDQLNAHYPDSNDKVPSFIATSYAMMTIIAEDAHLLRDVTLCLRFCVESCAPEEDCSGRDLMFLRQWAILAKLHAAERRAIQHNHIHILVNSFLL